MRLSHRMKREYLHGMEEKTMAEVKDRSRQWSSGRVKRPVNHRRKQQESLSNGERRRLTQLVVCMLLFGIVFIGRGAPEGQLHDLGQTLGEWVHRDTDFRAAFAKVGQSVSDGEPVTQTFGVLWSEVFGDGQTEQDGKENIAPTPEGESSGEGETQPSEGSAPPETTPPADTGHQSTPEKSPPAATADTNTQQEAATNNTQDALLGGETVAPVMGVLTSNFGYRTHPIDGQWKQHDGIDIMADKGTPIKAFADGVVDYVGESASYGLYLQVGHSDGVTSFYAHCSELLVKKGQKVKMGDTVAKVGDTGNVTGAHLHLELKKNGERIDPSLYVQTSPS